MAELTAEVTEDYLKHIYHLSLDSAPVKTSALANALKLSPASVTEMLKRLDDQKLVAYKRYHGVLLTRRGRKRALLVLRRHRLWEIFLFKVLDVPWPQLHTHAERLEHATDDRLADYLDAYLGNPRLDPHGHPIPAADGTVDEVDRLRLSSLTAGTSAVITQCINDGNQKLLSYLNGLGLVPGTRVSVGEQAPFNGPLSVTVGDRTCSVGVEAARTLLVSVDP